jgi:geranylgeranyl transferase type-2 subunit beta
MAFARKDAPLPADAPDRLLMDEHARFILKYDQDKEEYEFVMSEFLRLNAVYW